MNRIEFFGTDKEVLDFVGAKAFDYETDNNASVNVKLFGSHGHANVPLGYVFYKDSDEQGALSIVTDELDNRLTKAEDLLRRFIELKNKPCSVRHRLLYENIRSEAEQFLKEVK